MTPPDDTHHPDERDDAHAPDPRDETDAISPVVEPEVPLEAALLPVLSPAATPPPSLRARILAAARPQTFAFVMRDEGPWLPRSDAPVAVKELLADSRDRIATRLIRFQSGGPLPEPGLEGRRTFYVVRGAVVEGETREALTAGAFRDEYPPRAWRAESDTLLVEFSQRAAGDVGQLSQPGQGAPWINALPGGRVRPLIGGSEGPRSFLVLSMSPGATLPGHPHPGVEELFILSGSCTLDGRTLAAGDYHRAAAHSTHPDTRSLDDGCEVLVALRDADFLAPPAGAM